MQSPRLYGGFQPLSTHCLVFTAFLKKMNHFSKINLMIWITWIIQFSWRYWLTTQLVHILLVRLCSYKSELLKVLVCSSSCKFRMTSHSRWNMCLIRNIMSAPQKCRYCASHKRNIQTCYHIVTMREGDGGRWTAPSCEKGWKDGADERQSEVRMTWRNEGAQRAVLRLGGRFVLGFNLVEK